MPKKTKSPDRIHDREIMYPAHTTVLATAIDLHDTILSGYDPTEMVVANLCRVHGIGSSCTPEVRQIFEELQAAA